MTAENGEASGGTDAAAAAAAPTSAAPAATWTTGLDADSVGYVQNKGWKGPGDVLTSYRNLEKLHGVPPESILKLPKDDNPEAWGQIYDRLGRPKTAADYGIKAPEKGGDPKLVDAATAKFHELGLSAKQAAGVAEFWNKYAEGAVAERDGAYNEGVVADTAKLKGEWGGQYDANIARAKHAARAFGLDATQIDKMESALGFSGLMKFMTNLGGKLGTEDSFVGGDGAGAAGGFGMSRDGAMSRKTALMKDKSFQVRFAAGDVSARSEMRRLDMALSE